jgi:serine/threonine protein kinase
MEKSKSPSTRSYSREKQDEVYYFPKETAVKIIDFGGATRENERHSEIINTRQYRAPEVILGCCQWNEKSDVWCLACIFCELYTGELLFPTHNNEEHLSLIEKVSGNFNKFYTLYYHV